MFKQQIIEDINLIKDNYIAYNPHLEKDEFAFNYWILTKLFNVDEEVADNNITEYRDDGVDCFVFFEDSKELFIIQNKFYSEQTPLNRSYIQDDFLTRPLNRLIGGNYNRSEELQNIFNKYKNDSDFSIHLHLYVSNDNTDKTIIDMFEKYQNRDTRISCYVDAEIFYLKDIQTKYLDERKENVKNFKCDFYTINDGTVLNINTENYNLPNLIEAKYILTQVSQLHSIVKQSNEKEYSLFEENIREYLGNKGINAKIAKTLEDKCDRANFFYYNNGITVICDKIDKSASVKPNLNRCFTAYNPQIVNGCQTVSTIYHVLEKYNPSDVEQEFKNTYVMVKLLVLNIENEQESKLYKDIVKFNNSQNAITEKAFTANKQLFFNMQKEFEDRGLLLAVKQSDVNKFKTKYKFNDFRPRYEKFEKLFKIKFEKIEDIIIPLEKLLQIILAFHSNGYYAFTKKSQVLKHDTHINTSVVDFIKNSGFTMEDILKLYLLYLKAEREKKASEDLRTPIPFYLIGFIGTSFSILSNEKARKAFSYIFESENNISAIFEFYKNVTTLYKNACKNQKKLEYNVMIKTPIDDTILVQSVSNAKDFISDSQIRQIVNEFNDLIS
jgi:hypothetical protein